MVYKLLCRNSVYSTSSNILTNGPMGILMLNLPVIVYMWEYHLFYGLYNKQGKWLLPIIRGKSQIGVQFLVWLLRHHIGKSHNAELGFRGWIIPETNNCSLKKGKLIWKICLVDTFIFKHWFQSRNLFWTTYIIRE